MSGQQQADAAQGTRTVQGLVIPEPWRMELRELEDRALDLHCVRVDTIASGVSMGTEQSFFQGTNPALHSSFDGELGLFMPTKPETSFPVERFGYMEVARVVASRAARVREGDKVAMTYGHRTGYTADLTSERAVVLPEDLDDRLGTLVCHMGPIVANGLLHAAHEFVGPNATDLWQGVRDRLVCVTGGGFIGLMLARWARWLGAAEVIVLDSTAERREAAERLGCMAMDDSPVDFHEDVAETVKRRWRHHPGDRGADVVFQCRGQYQDLGLHEALRLLRPQGSVIDLAFYSKGLEGLRLGEEFHHNGLSIRCAQIGRVPRGMAAVWDRERLSRETIRFLAGCGPEILDVLITDELSFADAPELFTSVGRRERHVVGCILRP